MTEPLTANSEPAESAAVAVEPIEVGAADAPGLAIVESGPALLTAEEFFAVYSHLFPVAGGILAIYDPPPYIALMQAPELPTARPAFDALYRMAQRFDFMRWLIEKNTTWIGDVLALGAFGGQVYFGVRTEMEARRMQRDAEERARAASYQRQRRDGNWKNDLAAAASRTPPPGDSGGPGGGPGMDPQ